MSMSDCPKCWNTPCDCGHDYKDWPVARLEEMVSMFQGLIAEKTRQAKPKPKKLIRLDDGMEFVLNEATGLYRVHLGVPRLDDHKHLHHEYEYERLMEDPRSKGNFKIADGTEDIAATKKRWMDEMNRVSNGHGGHGNEDDE